MFLNLTTSFEINFNSKNDDFSHSFLIAVQNYFKQHRCKAVNVITEIELKINSDEIYKNIQKDFKIEITSEIWKFSNIIHKKRCNILIFNSIYSLIKIEKEINERIFKFSGYFFMAILHQHHAAEFELIFQKLWEKQIFNLYAMCRSVDDEILLLTFDPFMNTSNCGKAIPKIINKYHDGKFSKPLNFGVKFSNLNQCRMRVTTFADNVAVFKIKLLNGTEIIDGHEIKIINTIAKSLNFSIDLAFRDGDQQYGHVYENGTTTNSFNDLITSKTDIIIGDYYIKERRLKFFDASISFLSYPIFFITSRGEKLSAIEKLLTPFNTTVWYFLIASFFTTIFTMTLINFHYNNFKNSKLSEKFKSPIFVMLFIIFGSSLKNLPKKNFTRFFLMILILLCLVMRSIYQGSLYKFLQSDQRHKVPDTIVGLLNEEYTFKLYDSWMDIVDYDPKLAKNRVKLKYFEDTAKLIDFALQNSSKITTPISKLSMIKYSIKSRQFPYNICKDNLISTNVVQYFRKEFYLKKVIDSKLGALISSGIIEKWISEYDFTNYWKDLKKPPRVLTLNHLSGVFYLLITGFVISIFIFLIELYVG